MTIEEILKEIHIRFNGMNWYDQKLLYDANKDISQINKNNFIIELTKAHGYSHNGLLYKVVKDNICWGVANIIIKPEKWVVILDDKHPMMEQFKDWYYRYIGISTDSKILKYLSNDGMGNLIDVFAGYQYLTLEQWWTLIHNEDKRYLDINLQCTDIN